MKVFIRLFIALFAITFSFQQTCYTNLANGWRWESGNQGNLKNKK